MPKKKKKPTNSSPATSLSLPSSKAHPKQAENASAPRKISTRSPNRAIGACHQEKAKKNARQEPWYGKADLPSGRNERAKRQRPKAETRCNRPCHYQRNPGIHAGGWRTKRKRKGLKEKKKESVHLPRSPSSSRPSLSAPVQSSQSRPSWNPVGACPRGSVRVASREHSALLFLGQNPVPCMSDRSRDTQLEIKEKGKEESPGRRLSLRGRASRSRMQPVEVEMGKISTPCSAKSVVVSRPRRNFV